MLILATVPGTAFAAFTHDPQLNWQTLHSEHFEIHFHDDEQALAQTVADISERVYIKITDYFDWQPRAKTQVVLSDRVDYTNGYAIPVPNNLLVIYVTPPDDPIALLDNYDDFLTMLITHEFTHIVHIDKATRGPKILRNIFGRMDWLFPNAFQPPWVVEGIATYQESLVKPGVGRGNNSLYKGLMRLDVANGIKTLRQVNQPVTDWPVGITRYLYGVYYFNFLKEKYGDEGIKRWVDNQSDNIIPFLVNSTSARAFGKKLDGMWWGYQNYLKEQFNGDIATRTQRGLTPGKAISDTGYLTGYPRSLANGDLYYIKSDVLGEPKLMQLRNGASNPVELTTIHGDHFDIHPQRGVLIPQLDAVRNTNIYSDLSIIDLATLDSRQITHGKRYTRATWHPNGTQILAVHNNLRNKRLDLLNADGDFIETLWQGSHNEIVSDMQWTPDGNAVIAAVWREGGNWNLEQFTVATRQWKALTTSPAIEMQPVLSADGKRLLYSADYDGAFNIYQLDIHSGQTTQLTNVMGAAIAATWAQNDAGIYYMDLGKSGFDVYHVDKQHYFDSKTTRLARPSAIGQQLLKVSNSEPETRPATKVTTQVTTDIPATHYRVTAYSALGKVLPTSWFPYLLIDDQRVETGASTYGGDPLNRHLYNAFLAYDAKNNWSFGGFSYLYDRFNPSLKLAAFREVLIHRDGDDLEGFSNSDSYSAELLFPWLTRDRSMTFHIGLVSEHVTEKFAEVPSFVINESTDELAGVALTYNSAKRYARSVSNNDGQTFRLVYEDSDALDGDFTGQVATADWRGFLRLRGQHVLATRVVYGRGNDNPRPFRLGGISNGFFMSSPGQTVVTPTEEVFNKRQYALRGYPEGLTTLSGRRMALIETEWRFPVARIERGFMTPPVGIHQIHGRAFYNAGEAWQDSRDSSQVRHGAGIEINAEVVLGYLIGIDVRTGYAHGFDDDGEDQWYLRVGATF